MAQRIQLPSPLKSDNTELLHDAIIKASAELRALGKLSPSAKLTIGRLEIDHWSFTLPLLSKEDRRPIFFMKIHKTDPRTMNLRKALTDPSAADQARTEFESLVRLREFAEAAGLTSLVPLLYLREYNAVITQFMPGDELYERCRAAALWPPRNRDSVLSQLGQTGNWLRQLHDTAPMDGDMDVLDVHRALSETINVLIRMRPIVSTRQQVEDLISRLAQLRVPDDLEHVITVPGFEVRNVLVGDQGIVPLDPGKLGLAPRAADLARFTVSLDALFWGTVWFAAGLTASQSQLNAFLEGYGDARFGAALADRVYLLREWSSLWESAYFVLNHMKGYPESLRKLVAWGYIDRPIFNRLARVAHGLGAA